MGISMTKARSIHPEETNGRHPPPMRSPRAWRAPERAHRQPAVVLIGCERGKAAVDKWWEGERTMPRQWGCVLPQ